MISARAFRLSPRIGFVRTSGRRCDLRAISTRIPRPWRRSDDAAGLGQFRQRERLLARVAGTAHSRRSNGGIVARLDRAADAQSRFQRARGGDRRAKLSGLRRAPPTHCATCWRSSTSGHRGIRTTTGRGRSSARASGAGEPDPVGARARGSAAIPGRRRLGGGIGVARQRFLHYRCSFTRAA